MVRSRVGYVRVYLGKDGGREGGRWVTCRLSTSTWSIASAARFFASDSWDSSRFTLASCSFSNSIKSRVVFAAVRWSIEVRIG